MNKVLAHTIAELEGGAFKGEVLAVESRLGALRIEIGELGGTRRLEVFFAQAEAFRVMDERDLGEYWPECSTPNGWLFEVTDGGWLKQELERPGSLVARIHKELREFLIAGEDDCVSVLSLSMPEIRALAQANEA
jgi:hypothetical protein